MFGTVSQSLCINSVALRAQSQNCLGSALGTTVLHLKQTKARTGMAACGRDPLYPPEPLYLCSPVFAPAHHLPRTLNAQGLYFKDQSYHHPSSWNPPCTLLSPRDKKVVTHKWILSWNKPLGPGHTPLLPSLLHSSGQGWTPCSCLLLPSTSTYSVRPGDALILPSWFPSLEHTPGPRFFLRCPVWTGNVLHRLMFWIHWSNCLRILWKKKTLRSRASLEEVSHWG